MIRSAVAVPVEIPKSGLPIEAPGRIPVNENLERDITELLPRPVGRPSIEKTRFSGSWFSRRGDRRLEEPKHGSRRNSSKNLHWGGSKVDGL
jgi:hypothetical protein